MMFEAWWVWPKPRNFVRHWSTNRTGIVTDERGDGRLLFHGEWLHPDELIVILTEAL